MDSSPLTAPPELQWSAVLSILLLSIAVPAAIFLGRNNVRSIRRDLVRDLVNLFGFAKDSQGNPIVIPSLELVKWKYDPNPRHDPDRIAVTGEAPDGAGLVSFWYFLLPTCLYILFSCLGFCISFLPVMPERPTPFSLGGWPSLTDPERLSLLSTISYTFLGGYIWTIYYLIKRVSNFDLSPLSFLRASAHILFGAFVSAVLWHVINEFYRGSEIGSGRGIGIALAFLVGFFPELGLSRLLAKYPQMRLKRIGPRPPSCARSCRSTQSWGSTPTPNSVWASSRSRTSRTSPPSTRSSCSSKPHTICMKYSTGLPRRS